VILSERPAPPVPPPHEMWLDQLRRAGGRVRGGLRAELIVKGCMYFQEEDARDGSAILLVRNSKRASSSTVLLAEGRSSAAEGNLAHTPTQLAEFDFKLMSHSYLARLTDTGVLSYSFNPTSPIRDELLVPTSFVSANARHRTLHIDSGKTVYHVKALSTTEFNLWTACIKRFIHAVVEDGSLGQHEPPRAGSPAAGNVEDQGTGQGKLLNQVAAMAGVSIFWRDWFEL